MKSKSTSLYFHALRDAWDVGVLRFHHRKTYAAAWRWTGARKRHGAVKKIRYRKEGA